MRPVRFTVTNNLVAATGQVVVVLLRSSKSASTARHCVWRELDPGPHGGNQSFSYAGVGQLVVAGTGGAQTKPLAITPGERYEAFDEQGQGPELRPLANTHADGSVSVVNHTTSPTMMLSAKWLVDGHPAVIQSGLNEDSQAEFSLDAGLYFQVISRGDPSSIDQATQYITPPGTTTVSVTWSRPSGPDGADVLTFSPPSALSL